MEKIQKTNLNKQSLILKYILIIEGTYKTRSDLRIILDDFFKEIENLTNSSSKKDCYDSECGYHLPENKCWSPNKGDCKFRKRSPS